MRVAIPVHDGQLCPHFGHCRQFTIFETEPERHKVLSRQDLEPPAHEPGVLPRWLAEHGVRVVIAGGMGNRAIQLFSEAGIEVVTGAPVAAPEELLEQYCAGTLETGTNFCSH